MAYQPDSKKRKGGQINRTPAPDELTHIRAPQGGEGFGQNCPQPSSVAPGKSAQSALASNLRESQADADDVLSQIIAAGVAGRGDSVPADNDYDDVGGQLRRVSDQLYPIAGGGSMRRQQDPDFFTKKSGALPGKQIDNQGQPVRKPS